MALQILARLPWKGWLVYLGVVAVCGPFLYPALDFEFASDDRIMIVENRYMRDPANWWRMISTDAFDRTIEGFDYQVISLVGHWRPINKLSYLIDYTLWGPDSARFHRTGLLIHLATGGLLFCLGRLLGLSHLVAGASALLFLLHPLTARPLGLISLRADLWCGLFSMATILCAVRAEKEQDGRGHLFRGLSYAGAFLALTGKETALFLPVLFAGYSLCTSRGDPHPLRRAVIQVWPYFAVVSLYALVRFGIFSIAMGKQNEFPPMTAWMLFMSLSRLAFSYVSEVFAPTFVDRLWLPEILKGFPDWTVWLSWAALLGLAAALWWVWKRGERQFSTVLLLLILPVLPLLNIQAISGEDVGELLPFEAHRLYISIMGLALLWGLGMRAIRAWDGGWQRTGMQGLFLVALPVYPLLFPAELKVYRNTEALVQRKLRNTEHFSQDNLPISLQVLRLNQQAIELKRQERYREAAEVLEQVLTIQPYDAIALKNLAVIALLLKEPDRAIGYLETVLSPVPLQAPDGSTRRVIDDPQLRHTGEVQKVLGQAYQMKGDHEKARGHFSLSRKIDPTDLEVLLLLAWNATLRGDAGEAMVYLEQFLQEAPANDERRVFATRKMRELTQAREGAESDSGSVRSGAP